MIIHTKQKKEKEEVEFFPAYLTKKDGSKYKISKKKNGRKIIERI